MPLKTSDGIGAWIKDFQKSDAPQFKGKSKDKRRDQAIAAYLSKKRGPQEGKKLNDIRTEDKQQEIDRIKATIDRHTSARNAAKSEVSNTKDHGEKLRHTTRAQSHQKAILRAQERLANMQKDEGMDFKVSVDGLPDMFMTGNSPGGVKAHLRKLLKQPSMIKDVERVTRHDKKKELRKRSQTEEMKCDDGSPEANKYMRKKTPGQKQEGKLTIGKIRRMAYKGAKAAGDVQAVRKNKVGQRIKRRIAGKIAGKLIGALTK